ncbi:hypothetical protein TrST_g65 [Triparma strigata]|uniref:TLC domain-containing protein n=1 Tax=Triparma strigata TaxID=1606541 RepID=A0A9W7BHK3_9STRA|nr:hypothetical protein TrST_g65 [Triparma strigata]
MMSALYLTVLDSLIFVSFAATFQSATTASLTHLGGGFLGAAALNSCTHAVLPVVFKRLYYKDTGREDLNKRYNRFHEMINTLVQMIFFVYFEVVIFRSNSWLWWSDTTTAWTSDPVPSNLRMFYGVNLGTWLTAAVTCRFYEERNKDWLLMYTHHAASIILVAGSYAIGQERFGIMVLFLHHISDIVLNCCQATHYLGWDAESFPFGIPVAEVLFVCNICCWAYTRLYIFPFTIVRSVTFEIAGIEGEKYARMLSVFLYLLQGMHIWWFSEMIRVVVKILTPGVSAKEAASVYLTEREEEAAKKKKTKEDKKKM